MMKISFTKIDWLNHLVAFFSALLGILIAFELDSYREKSQETEKLKVTLTAIRNELENNITTYSHNVTVLSDWLEYFELSKKFVNGELKLEQSTFERLKKDNPDRFQSWTIERIESDSFYIFLERKIRFQIDVGPISNISNSSWQAALYSGVLHRLDHERVVLLTQMYDWVAKDIGLNDREFNENIYLNEVTDIDMLVDYYKSIVKIHRAKHDNVKRYYGQVNWNL